VGETAWAVTIVVAYMAMSLLGMVLVRRTFSISTLAANNDVAGFVYAVLGVVYAVLMAFVVTVVWGRFDRAESVVSQEAHSLVDLSRLANSFPVSGRLDIQRALLAYGRVVVEEERELMARSRASDRATQQVDALWQAYQQIEPTTNREVAAYRRSLEHLDELDDARAARLLLARNGTPFLMWVVLIVGAQVTVAFSFLFGVKSAYAQTAIVTVLAATVALVLSLIAALDHPFDGLIRVEPGPFQFALETIERAVATP
jgi:hypothetical protein